MCFWNIFDLDGDGELDDMEKAFGAAAFLGFMEDERRRKEAEEKAKAEREALSDFPSLDDIMAERYGYKPDDDDDKDEFSW